MANNDVPDEIPPDLCLHYLIIIILITTLFQEDNIFDTKASLTYGPQIQRQLLTEMKIIYSMYRRGEVSKH